MDYEKEIESLLKFLEQSKIADLLTEDQYKQVMELNIVHWDEDLKEVLMPYIGDILREESEKFSLEQSKKFAF